MKSNRNIARFIETLDNLSKSGKDIPGLILSRPGFGKTSTISMWAKYKDYNFFSLIPSRYASDDIVGLQSVEKGTLTRLKPSWFNKFEKMAENGKRNLLFVDEITTCDPYIQGPLLDLIFNHSLGEGYVLPNNTLIVAAGNYSSDLNGVFKMSAPLINRFEILNLNNEDYDLVELLDSSFDNVESNEEIENFLGIEPDKILTYSFNKFKDWVRTSREVQFGKSEITEDDEFGILGFTSIRSLTFTMSFVEAYVGRYSDSLWQRVAGDTLGLSVKREGKLMRDVIASCEENFINLYADERSISDVCDDIMSCKKILKSDLERLESLVKYTSIGDITENDYDKFINVIRKFPNNPDIKYIAEVMQKKVLSESSYSEI